MPNYLHSDSLIWRVHDAKLPELCWACKLRLDTISTAQFLSSDAVDDSTFVLEYDSTAIQTNLACECKTNENAFNEFLAHLKVFFP
mmetsp:Transcript_25502/g.54136  ORF Transcript_25502/g.54136 Transcript_25502/m.54136 type:complete len:86 (-) Transcript_25502:473-730(-)